MSKKIFALLAVILILSITTRVLADYPATYVGAGSGCNCYPWDFMGNPGSLYPNCDGPFFSGNYGGSCQVDDCAGAWYFMPLCGSYACPAGGYLTEFPIPMCLTTNCTSPRYPAGWQVPGSLSAGQKIYAADISKIRVGIDLMRADAGLGNCVGGHYTQTPAPGVKIKASDMNEMRACILQVYDACGVGRPATSVNSTVTAGSPILSSHWTDLWSAVANAP